MISKFSACWLVVLILSPFTAPFSPWDSSNLPVTLRHPGTPTASRPLAPPIVLLTTITASAPSSASRRQHNKDSALSPARVSVPGSWSNAARGRSLPPLPLTARPSTLRL